jgi:hypothetical protein
MRKRTLEVLKERRDSVQAMQIEFEFVRGEITVPTPNFDDSKTLSFMENSDRQETFDARRSEFENRCRKLTIPRAASTDVNRGTIPIVYSFDL